MARISRPSNISRRAALRTGGAGIVATLGASRFVPGVLAQEAAPADAVQDGLSEEIIEAFKGLPGQQGVKLWAPPDAGRAAWSVEVNPDERLFIASVFKGFVLAECLRLEEESLDPQSATPLGTQLNARLAQQLPLDDSVFSLSAPVMNSPHLTGEVTLRTALEAMIAHSDNTATDIVLRHVGPERVQSFIDGIGLQESEIPASTREFFGYVFGVEDWQATTWDQLQNPDPDATPQPILNDTITMASTPNELISFYSRALPGEFFQYAETLAVFRAILAIGDAVLLSMPLGVSGFGKGGSIDFNGSHVLTFAGGMYVPDRWVYFALLVNWTDDQGGLSTEVLPSYIAASKTVFTLVRDRLRL